MLVYLIEHAAELNIGPCHYGLPLLLMSSHTKLSMPEGTAWYLASNVQQDAERHTTCCTYQCFTHAQQMAVPAASAVNCFVQGHSCGPQ